MSQSLHSHPSYLDIHHRVQTLTQADGGEVMPPLPHNNEPQPRPLRNSSVYYPLPPSVATAQLNYLHNSLAHPEVTGPRSFHAIVLTANYLLRLEPDEFRGQQVQRTHAYNATLAEIQGPDGLPISSRVGHAVILFYPGEHEHTGPASASVQLTDPSTLKVPLEEGEVLDAAPLPNLQWQSYMCRYDTTPANEPSIKPFPILRGSKCSPTPHSLLPNTFVLPVQRIITIKLDEARAVFRVPKDYTLRMRVDNDELRELVRGLPLATAVRLDYITRTLVRVANDRGTALILHNPVYLET
ncbi:hypothetical protein ARMSODRAFT_971711, partial [Armillaria solidipes]